MSNSHFSFELSDNDLFSNWIKYCISQIEWPTMISPLGERDWGYFRIEWETVVILRLSDRLWAVSNWVTENNFARLRDWGHSRIEREIVIILRLSDTLWSVSDWVTDNNFARLSERLGSFSDWLYSVSDWMADSNFVRDMITNSVSCFKNNFWVCLSLYICLTIILFLSFAGVPFIIKCLCWNHFTLKY